MVNFQHLPFEVVTLIASYLSPITLLTFSYINVQCKNAAQPYLLKLRARYSRLETFSTIMEILNDHELGIFAQSISVGGGFIDMNMTLDVWTKYVKDCSDKIGALGFKTPLISQILDHGEVQVVTGTIAAHVMALCPNVKSLSLDKSPSLPAPALVMRFTEIVGHDYTHDMATAPPRTRPSTLTVSFHRLESLTINSSATIQDLSQCLTFPALHNLKLVGIIAPRRNNVNLANLHVRHTCAIRQLQLLHCDIPLSVVVSFLGLIQRDTLRTLALTLHRGEDVDAYVSQYVDGAIDDGHRHIPLYRPAELFKLFHALGVCANSLEALVFCTSPAFMMKRIGPLGQNDSLLPGEDARHHFSSICMDAHNNLATFPRLRRVTLDAHLLLGGFGIVEYARRCEWASEGVRKGLQRWVECDPSDTPPLRELLPVSLESLDIHLYKNQIHAMGQRLHEEVGTIQDNESPAGLPNLVTVRLFVGFPYKEQVAGYPYWSRAGGVSGLINGAFWEGKIINGSGAREETRADQRLLAFHERETHLWEDTSLI